MERSGRLAWRWPMQGSAISGVDVAGVTIKVNDDGFYSMTIGAADMGTGCDTTLAQVAAECLECDPDDFVVLRRGYGCIPYDSGSYASSTAYLTGMAVVKACRNLREKIVDKAAQYLECSPDELEFDGRMVRRLGKERVSGCGCTAAGDIPQRYCKPRYVL